MIGCVTLVCVFVPLRLLAHAGVTACRGGPGSATYFAATGVGYLAIEIALLQEFGLFLGHPSYSLSVVLAALLFTTRSRIALLRAARGAARRVRFVSYALAGVVLTLYGLVLPRLPGLVALRLRRPGRRRLRPHLARSGFLLGVFVPSALERLKVEAPRSSPGPGGSTGSSPSSPRCSRRPSP